jgi:hypothetical protein
MVAHAFVASQRLRTGVGQRGLASFETILRWIVRDSAIQRLLEEYEFDTETAIAVALEMLRGYSDW